VVGAVVVAAAVVVVAARVVAPPWLPPPAERSTRTATQRPPERRTVASMDDTPRRSPANVTCWKVVAFVTRMRIVPRSASRRRKVWAARLTETTVPS
jgi:hypothetical protein